jgi:hypothetical protein
MDTVYFLARFAPFWAIPIMIIGSEFAYLFWVRKKKSRMMIALVLVVISFFCTSMYWYLGGPEKTVKFLVDIVWFYTR